MVLIRSILAFIFTVCFFTFVAFFGRLPAFRNSPIGFLHRLLVVHIPAGLRKFDLALTNGCITNGGARLGNYLMNDKHPLVVVFFLGLVSACASLFLPTIWPLLPSHHRLLTAMVLPQPYLFVYLSAKSNGHTYINALNHAEQMRHYPYDRVLFHPGNICATCHLLKPARSKHCSICKTCVSRMDHHCIWVNNCLGRGNYKWFLALLLSTSILIAYGAYLAYATLSPLVDKYYNTYEHWYRYMPSPASDPSSWSTYFDIKLHYFLAYLSIYLDVGGLAGSGVGLLALLTWPLPLGLLLYHVYLIWAGMTTNESGKWSDWRDDMADGVVFLGQRRDDTLLSTRPKMSARGQYRGSARPTDGFYLDEEEEPPTSWPYESKHILVRTRDGQPPKTLPARLQLVAKDGSFERIWNLNAVENVYDLGLWGNFMEVLLQ